MRHGRRDRFRPGFTLIELVVSLAVMAVLLVAMGSAVVVASRGVDAAESPAALSLAGGDAVSRLAAELQLAVSVTNASANGVTFTVPDRTGDDLPETIDYVWTGAPAYQLVRSFNGSAAEIVAADVREFALTYDTRFVAGVPPPPSEDLPPRVLLIVESPDSLTTAEATFREWIFDAGYLPVVVASSASPGDLGAAIDDAVAAYVSSDVVSTAFLPALYQASIGVVAADAASVTGLALADGTSVATKVDMLEISSTEHFITAGLPALPMIFTDDRDIVAIRAGDGPGVGLEALAWKPADTNNCAVSVIETGGPLADDTLAAGRRVHLPWGAKPVEIDKLTSESRTLFEQSIAWAAGADTGGGGPTDVFGYGEAFAASTSDVRRIQIGTQVTLGESGTLTSLSVYTTGGSTVRLGIYSDAGGEPDTLLAQTASAATSGTGWVTIEVDPTPLAPGTYWIAVAFKSKTQAYFWQAGGETRYTWHDAEGNGFLTVWGGSSQSYDAAISMYGTYTVGGP